ncbi:F-box domain protein [Onchocerca flexuosa]|uniref:F-box domain protein n=2 Tax=Onchocerca flexuosa TaxID=387005 RepID=A0A238BVA0_9BILA|nr:F-box domain protein [Onchocerca flexuosa]
MSNPGHSELFGATLHDSSSSDGDKISFQNTSFTIASSMHDCGNRQRSASVAWSHYSDWKARDNLMKSPRGHHYQKRKSSLFDDSFRGKKPALSRLMRLGDYDYLQNSHSEASHSYITPLRITKLAQCESLLQKYNECEQIGTYNDYRDNPNLTNYHLDSPESPNIDDSDEEKEREKQEEQKEKDYEKSQEAEHQINENLLIWIKQFKMLSSSDQMDALTDLVNECSLDHIRHLRSVIEPFFQKDFIKELPKEIALHVMCFLSPADIARISLTCRYWRNLAEDNRLWRKKCEEVNVTAMDEPRQVTVRIAAISLSILVDRKSGAWAETASTSGIEIVGYRPVPNYRLALFTDYHPHWLRYYSDADESPKNVCLARSKWKALYLRHQRILANWRYRPLRGSCILKGHDEHVITCLQIHGDLIVTGSDDNTLKIWSASKAMCLQTLTGHTGGVWSSQMSEDGKTVTSGSTDRTVRVWCVETGRCLHCLQGHTSTVRCMTLRDDKLVTGSRDTSIRLWNIKDGACIRTLQGHVAAVRCVQFDGLRIVSGAYDFSVKVWDAESGRCLHTLTGHSNRVYSLLFDSERDIVISGSLDTTIKVWNIHDGVCTQTLTGHQSLTSGMQLRGNILVSGNADSTIKIWDIMDGECKYTLSGPNRHASAVTSLQFLENGLVATSSDDGSVKLWDVKQGEFVRDLVRLRSGGSGGCIWRLKSTSTMLVCAVGSRNGTEDTKLILLDFDADYP